MWYWIVYDMIFLWEKMVESTSLPGVSLGLMYLLVCLPVLRQHSSQFSFNVKKYQTKIIVKSFMYKYFLLFIHLIYALVEQLSDPTHIVFVNHISKINLLEIITFHLQFVYYLRVISTLKFRCQNTVYMNFRKLLYCF